MSSWFYGFIVVEVTSPFLVFVWFDFCASNKCVLFFMVFTVAEVTSAFLFLWFDCCASDKCVPCFTVLLWRKCQARSWVYGLIVAQVTGAFWFL